MKAPTDLFAIEHPELIGWHDGMSNEDYHGGPGVSKSTTDQVHKSIDHWLRGERKETPSMAFGTACHTALLEPETFWDLYEMGPNCSANSQDWKDAAAKAGDKILLKEDVIDKVFDIVKSVLRHPVAGELFRDPAGIPEGSLYQEDPDTGLLLRTRPDWLMPKAKIITDFKTAVRSDHEGFASSVKKWRYQVQHAIYTDCVSRYFGEPFDFIFVAVEKVQPYAVGVYQLSETDVAWGRRLYKEDLAKIVAYLKGNMFPGYSPYIEQISINKRSGQ